jgi:signal recognition particle subunit SRP68
MNALSKAWKICQVLSRWQVEDPISQKTVEKLKSQKIGSTTESQALAMERMDELETKIRFCVRQLGGSTPDSTLTDIQSIIEPFISVSSSSTEVEDVYHFPDLISKLNEKVPSSDSSASGITVQFRSRTITVRNVEMSRCLARSQDSVETVRSLLSGKSKKKGKSKKRSGGKRLAGKRMEEFDRALGRLADAESEAKRIAEGGGRVDVSNPSLSFASSLITSRLILLTLTRDTILLSSQVSILRSREARLAAAFTRKLLTPLPQQRRGKKKVLRLSVKQQREAFDRKLNRKRARVYPVLIKLLGGIIANWESLRDLRIIAEDGGPSTTMTSEGNESFQEIQDLVSAVEAQICLAKAKRNLLLSRIYGFMLEQYAEGMDLISRGKNYVKEGKKATRVNFPPEIEGGGGVEKLREDEKLFWIGDKEWDSIEIEFQEDWNKIGRIWFEKERSESGEGKDQQPFLDIAYSYVVDFDLDAIGELGQVKGKKKKEKMLASEAVKTKVEKKVIEKPKVDQNKKEPRQQGGGGFWGFFGMGGNK